MQSKAGGQLGAHIVKELLARGAHTVTAITREGSTNKIIDGVKTATVHYDDHASLVSAMQSQDCLIVTLAVTAPPETNAKLFKAAAEANVRWVIPNGFGGDSSDPEGEQATKLQYEAQRSILESLGLNWTGVACSFW
jgi:uncharacterized protein YbjT (DUF2867 family)